MFTRRGRDRWPLLCSAEEGGGEPAGLDSSVSPGSSGWGRRGGVVLRDRRGCPGEGTLPTGDEKGQFAQWPESELRGPGDGERPKAAVARLESWHSRGAGVLAPHCAYWPRLLPAVCLEGSCLSL